MTAADHASRIDFDYITDGIFIGTNQCCQTHFEESLLKKGVTTIHLEDVQRAALEQFAKRMKLLR